MTFLYLALPFVIGELRFGLESWPMVTVVSLTLVVLGHKVWNLYLRFGGRGD